MRVGITLPQYGIDFEGAHIDAAATLAYAAAAESRGLDSVWASDHAFAVAPDGSVSGALDPGGVVAAVAARTERLEVGTLVLGTSLSTPAQLVSIARSWLAVGGGRVTCGLGAGWNPATHHAFGIDLPAYDARALHLRTCAEVLEVRLPGLPLLIGGWGPPVLAVAARHGHKWNLAWDPPANAFRSASAALDAACTDADRDPVEVQRGVGLTVLPGPSRSARESAIARVASRAPFLSGLTLAHLEDRILVGTYEECADRIAGYGADEVVLAPFVRDDLDLVAAIATEIAPLLR